MLNEPDYVDEDRLMALEKVEASKKNGYGS